MSLEYHLDIVRYLRISSGNQTDIRVDIGFQGSVPVIHHPSSSTLDVAGRCMMVGYQISE